MEKEISSFFLFLGIYNNPVGVFDKMKQMAEMKKMYDQAKVLQKKLAQMVIDVEENNVKVVVTGDVKIKELIIDGAPNKRVLDAINKALDKAQKQAAKQMQEDAGGISGLLKGFGY